MLAQTRADVVAPPATDTGTSYANTVVCAGLGDVAALSVLAAARTRAEFVQQDTPWPFTRAEVLIEVYAALIGHALRHGSVDVLPEGRGVAVWLDRTCSSAAFAAADGGRPGPVAATLRWLLGDTEPGIAHLHLVTLAAVDGRAAAALLGYRHRRLDRLGAIAYTVARSEDRVAALTAAGYVPTPPGPGATVAHRWRMLRPPTDGPSQRRAAAIELWPPDIDR
jgi:hypothetical protein